MLERLLGRRRTGSHVFVALATRPPAPASIASRDGDEAQDCASQRRSHARLS